MTNTRADETLRRITGGDKTLTAILAETLDRSRHETTAPPAQGLTTANPEGRDSLHFFSPLCGDPRDRLSAAGRRHTALSPTRQSHYSVRY